MDAGMNIARLNCSHGTHKEKARTIQYIRELMKEKQINIGILLDNKGPEIRTKSLANGEEVFLKEGNTLTLTTKEAIGNEYLIATDYKNITQDVKKWDKILLDDGLIALEVHQVEKEALHCTILNSWVLWENKSINLPGIKVTLPSLTQQDKEDLIFWCQQWIDYYALSFTRSKEDIVSVKKILQEQQATDIKIICKIENQEWIDNFDEILQEADGIMVARGDLWVEISPENLPIEQKNMIAKCVNAEKIAITATEMLDSMIRNPRPTNAEVTDVATAIFNGSDAVMLSGETAKWKYPHASVMMMRKICEKVDQEKIWWIYESSLPSRENLDNVDIIAKSIVHIAQDLESTCIVVASQTGNIVKKIRKYFPLQKIIVITNIKKTYHQMNLIRWAYAYFSTEIQNFEDFEKLARKLAVDIWWASHEENIVISCGKSFTTSWMTQWLKIVQI